MFINAMFSMSSLFLSIFIQTSNSCDLEGSVITKKALEYLLLKNIAGGKEGSEIPESLGKSSPVRRLCSSYLAVN